MSAGSYTDLPFPENQRVALVHSLLARGIITEDELRDRLEAIRTRLEAEWFLQVSATVKGPSASEPL